MLVVSAIVLLAGRGVGAFAAGPGGTASGQRHSLLHDGIVRGYVVREPAGLARRQGKLPLVLVLHGGGGNAANAETMTGFTEKANEEGFLVAYPEGTSRFPGRLLTWNAGHCCGLAMATGVDDVGFIGALLDRLVEAYPVDPRRIYATGMSNGGMMAHRLGIELSGRFAAIAPVVATLFGDEKTPEGPVAAIMINGGLDESVPHEGGPPGGRFAAAWDGTPARPAVEQASFWARANGCADEPHAQDRGRVTTLRYRCPAGRGVELYLVEDNGHAWPGGRSGSRRGDEPSASLDATDLVWEFFTAQVKERGGAGDGRPPER